MKGKIMPTGENMTRKRKANEFLVWRAGNSVSWDCTYAEIAAETNLNEATVSNICRAKGWKTRHDKARPGRRAVDAAFGHNSGRKDGRFIR